MSQTDFEAGDLQWRKARRSVGNGACVEVARANGQVFIRDSQNQSGPVVSYSGSSWRSFLADAKQGQFDLSHLY
jgi:hypothetical protein